ncbi:four-carbon acid sugar kinase family protein [Kineococcus sp. SYSU DK003]|uniref:four-carbon acid sugar kinase family protein n=1 Tax=Kineococcus sp. SYSU DK003 TaxID=3383124 RepID=UPI003D7D21D4
MDHRPIPPARTGTAVTASDVAAAVARTGTTLVVLDDDPTGTQSVADLPVLTRWEEPDFVWAFEQRSPAVYVLTNTRSLGREDAAARNREVVVAALAAAARTGTHVRFVSRSDSTLRGHFPLETDTLAAVLAEHDGRSVDAVVLVPAFPDAGRITLHGWHFVRVGGEFVPVGDSEFAADATFGFSSSDLPAWVQEKTGGRVSAADVVVLDIDTVRAGAQAVRDVLLPLTGGRTVVADTVDEDDLRAVCLGLALAEEAGREFLYRVGPPFVRARIGQEARPPLERAEIFADVPVRRGGGLVVVGSHVGLTSRQLAVLQAERPQARSVVIDVPTVLDPARAPAHLQAVGEEIARRLPDGDVVLHTSRVLQRSDDPAESLQISRTVSAAVVDVVRAVLAAHPPRFVVAKGGITSSDVAAHGLQIRHAVVRGPMLPGIVSLWEPVAGPAAGIPYVVFAGNVGDDDSLAAVVRTLADPAHP